MFVLFFVGDQLFGFGRASSQDAQFLGSFRFLFSIWKSASSMPKKVYQPSLVEYRYRQPLYSYCLEPFPNLLPVF